MKRGMVLLCVVLLLVQAGGVFAQPAATDAEVLKGITQAEEGEYDLAIFTLDTACRRLAEDPSKSADLSQAYLYLGIAYFGKGHEAAAKAKFREAVIQFRGLSLSAEQYPPKIVDLFEAARAEATSEPAAPAEPGAPAEPAAPGPTAAQATTPDPEKGGSKMPLILIGVGGAAAAGVAVAAGGGGGEDATPAQPAAPPRVTRNFPGDLAEPDALCRDFEIFPQAAGRLEAELTWTDAAQVLDLYLWMGEPWNSEAVRENRTSETSARLEADVAARAYVFGVCLGWSECRQAWQDSGGTTDACHTEFTLTVSHP